MSTSDLKRVCRSLLVVALLLFGLMYLNGCALLAFGFVGATAGTTAAVSSDPRSSGTIVDDNTIAVKLRAKYADYDNSNIYVNSYNGNILLTGQVPNNRVRERVLFNARVTPGVRHIYDYLDTKLPQSFASSSRDTFITTTIRAKLFNMHGVVGSVNVSSVKVVTTDKVVYLFGIVNQQQAQAVSQTAAGVDGVKKVVTLFEYVH